MRTLTAYLLMAICPILAAMNIYVSLHPPKAETIQIEPARDDDRPLMSGTPVKKVR
jgi:hypothetical protein